MNNEHLKWWIGAISIPMIVLFFTAISTYQSYVDRKQDSAIEETKRDSMSRFQEAQEALQEVSDNGRKTAEALSQVATTLREIDSRGSMALRDHERLRDGEVH